MKKRIFALLLLAFQSAAADTLPGRVVVADGDTLTVLDQKHEQHKVRLSGIDAPEKSQPFGQRSKQSLSDLAYGRSVSVDWRKRDRYRRIVGKVFEGGQDLNLEQVRRGLAWHYKHYQNEQDTIDRARYADAESEAHPHQGQAAYPRCGYFCGYLLFGCLVKIRGDKQGAVFLWDTGGTLTGKKRQLSTAEHNEPASVSLCVACCCLL